jgi:hypothetical protein
MVKELDLLSIFITTLKYFIHQPYTYDTSNKFSIIAFMSVVTAVVIQSVTTCIGFFHCPHARVALSGLCAKQIHRCDDIGSNPIAGVSCCGRQLVMRKIADLLDVCSNHTNSFVPWWTVWCVNTF